MTVKATSQAIEIYKKFHGKKPMLQLVMDVPKFNNLVFLANPEFITYESNKKNGGGTGKKEFFKHKFAKSTKMYCSPDGKMLVIMGPKLKVNSRGIVG